MKTFTLQICKGCRLEFEPVDWLEWRRAGFCSFDCWRLAGKVDREADDSAALVRRLRSWRA